MGHESCSGDATTGPVSDLWSVVAGAEPTLSQTVDEIGGIESLGIERCDDFELVTSGGVHASGDVFSDRFTVRVRHHCPRAVLVPLDARPVTGAVLLALELVP